MPKFWTYLAVLALVAGSSCDATHSQGGSSGVSVTYSGDESSQAAPSEESPSSPEQTGDDRGTSQEKTTDNGPSGLLDADTRLPSSPKGLVQEAELRSWPGSIVDGDTLKAVGFGESIRLLCIDTDETYSPKERALAERLTQRGAWSDYIAQKQKEVDSQGRRFGNYGTQMGAEAKAFARDFFEGVKKIKVEYESPTRTHGFFGRHLAYVWVERNGDWVNYNIEAVRAGMTPYYTKYGFSQLYHMAFEAAQAQAREAKRGIWANDSKGYPDYPERIQSWKERAGQIQTFRDRFDDRPNYVDLAEDTAFANLRRNVGERMVVFGEPTSLKERGQPQRMRMSYRYRRDFTVVAFDPHELTAASADPDTEEFVYVEGVVEMYRGDPQIRFDAESFLRSGRNPPGATD